MPTNFNNLKFLRLTGIAVCVSYFVFLLWQSLSFLPHDFSNSYFGAYFFLKGKFDLRIFDPLSFNQNIYAEGFRNIFASYNPNPPFTALFFIPFALLPLTLSKFIFNLVTAVLFLCSAYRLAKFLDIDPGLLFLIIPIIFFVPIRNEILFGQTYFLLFFLLVEGFLALERKSKIIGSLFWALAILLKIFPIIIFLFLVLKKDWRSTVALALICLILLGAAVILQGFDVWYYYLTQVIPRNGRGEISVAYMTNYQSAHMFFKYAFLQNKDYNANPFINSNFLFQGFQILFKSVVLGFCSIAVLKRKGVVEFGLLLLGAILLSPYGSTYQNLLLAIILIASYNRFSRKIFWLITFLIFLVGNFPLNIFNALPEWLQFPRLALYVFLLCVICYELKIKLQWKTFTIFVVLFSTPLLFRNENEVDDSYLLFKQDRRSLIYNYGIKNNHIFYQYWHENGENTCETKMNASMLSVNNIELKENQIFYKGKKITHGTDNKIKPALLDDKAIIYLSDKDKGIGFYSVRLIDLDDVQ